MRKTNLLMKGVVSNSMLLNVWVNQLAKKDEIEDLAARMALSLNFRASANRD